ncbi:MAG: penicillin-binding protein 2 [Candidatus Omnitrophica bacterium]|nr:penicillin-binding protein 2 [Candidatus Omnitrophota bacterium]
MRLQIFSKILISLLIFLLAGLLYTQSFKHDEYKLMSEQNRLRVLPLAAPRGSIFDRNGKVIAKDDLSFNLSLIYSQMKDKEKIIKALENILLMPEEKAVKKIQESRRMPYSPVVIANDIGTDAVIKFEEIISDYPGLVVEPSTIRKYTNEQAFSHLVGYLGLINRTEFNKLKHYGYRINDLVGRSGLELQYDNYLRGVYGGKQVEVDNIGREIEVIGYKKPIPGRNIYLSIDADLQEFCFNELKDRKGVIIALDPRSGEIYAMVSYPAYNPSYFIDSSKNKIAVGFIYDKTLPMINRAISGQYPPGSIFKIVTSTAALETRMADKTTSFNCSGYVTLGKFRFNCWKKSGHGTVSIVEAIKYSCNVFFYRLGMVTGDKYITKYSEIMGLGKKTGLVLPGEEIGNVPSEKWKKKRFNEPWYKGDTLNFSIGQGYLLVTPIQLIRMFSCIANKGFLFQPYLVLKIDDVNVAHSSLTPIGISKNTIAIITEGLIQCVNGEHGTGMRAKSVNMTIAGKTGTAQTGKANNHGWFAGFAPSKDPKLAVLVLDEYGEGGGYFAAETGGKVFEKARELGLV